MTIPFPFQNATVDAINHFNGKALLALEMGLGKTLCALLYAQQHPELRPIIAVVPAMLKENWRREAAKHIGMHGVILSGTRPHTDPKILNSPLLIINYDILKAWLPLLLQLNPKLVIGDEGHYLQSAKSQRTKAFKLLCMSNDPATLILTGTPITNRPADLWPSLNILIPRKYPSFWNYAREYCNLRRTPWGWDHSGASNLPKLHKELLQSCMIRYRKAEVLQQLPPMRRIVQPIELTDRKQYDLAEKDFMGWVLQNSPVSLKTAQKAVGLVRIGHLLRLTATLKLPLIREWIDNFMASDDGKLTVYGIHRKIVESLHETYSESVLVHGGITGKKRQNAVDAFQKNKGVKLFFGNLKAAGVGLTLTAASTGLLVEFGWTPGDHIQAEARINRIGQTKDTTMYWLVGRDTIEEKLIKVLQTKQRNIDAAVDGAGDANTLDVYDMLIDELRKDHSNENIQRKRTKRYA